MKKDFKMFKNVLSTDEMKRIMGGYGGGTCGIKSDASGYEVYGISKEDAQAWAGYFGTNWCCDSCGGNGGSASYY